MPQAVGVILGVVGLTFGIFRDYQNGNIRIPQFAQTSQNVEPAQTSQTTETTKTPLPMQFCLMAYDPNTDLVWYQHESGAWHTTPPAQKKIGTYY